MDSAKTVRWARMTLRRVASRTDGWNSSSAVSQLGHNSNLRVHFSDTQPFHMRKRPVTPIAETSQIRSEEWLDVERSAIVEITSEDAQFPIESAFMFGEGPGWRAGTSGTQTIRLIFDRPQNLRRIELVFKENESARTQEFLLRWSSDSGSSFRDIVRQQWNFSPPGSVEEFEDYQVQLSGVTVLELILIPNISGGDVRGSLKSLRLS